MSTKPSRRLKELMSPEAPATATLPPLPAPTPPPLTQQPPMAWPQYQPTPPLWTGYGHPTPPAGVNAPRALAQASWENRQRRSSSGTTSASPCRCRAETAHAAYLPPFPAATTAPSSAPSSTGPPGPTVVAPAGQPPVPASQPCGTATTSRRRVARLRPRLTRRARRKQSSDSRNGALMLWPPPLRTWGPWQNL
jgi:hypothetical protein